MVIHKFILSLQEKCKFNGRHQVELFGVDRDSVIKEWMTSGYNNVCPALFIQGTSESFKLLPGSIFHLTKGIFDVEN